MRPLSIRGSILHAFTLGLCLVACGDDDAPAIVTPPAKTKDAGGGDLGFDADVPLPRPDTGVPMKIPGMPEQGLDGTCAIDSNKIFTVAERDQPFSGTPLAVDPINSVFALPFVANGGCLDAVHMATLFGDAQSGAPKSDVVIDECSLVRDAVTAAMGDSWLVALIDNRQPPYDVWVESYDAAQKKMGPGQRISQGSSVEAALALTALRNGEGAMLAWSDEDDAAGQTLYARSLDKQGKPRADSVVIDQSKALYFRGLAIKGLGMDGAGLVYWRYSIDFAISDLVFVALDAAGKPLREKWVLAGNVGPSGSIDLTLDEEGGGIVYARAEAMTGRQLWFQQIDDTGQAALSVSGTRAAALRFVNAPFKGIDVSVAKLRSSFAVAYRALPALNETRAQIRLYFLDRNGAVIGDSDVSFTSVSGGRTAIHTAYDGRVVIGWSQVNEDGKSVMKVVRLPCVGG
jgi:hypothetical protein